MPRAETKALLLGALLLGFALGGSAPARAQLVTEPADLSVLLLPGEEAQRTLTLTNAGAEPLMFCLSFGRPLEDGPEGPRLASDALSSACGEYGEELFRITEADIPFVRWDIYGLTMMSDGRLFAADVGALGRTYELTPDLEYVRSFEHPFVEEVAPFNATNGITYNADTGTLWWTNGEHPCSIDNCFGYERVLLLEGDLDGNATGRRIEVPIAEEAPEPADTGIPTGAVYDAVADRYYYLDFANDNLWAIDTLGNVIEGYPVEQDAYPGNTLAFVVDAHRDLVGTAPEEPSADPGEGVWIEIGVNRPGDFRVTRIVALDAYGHWSGIETPTPLLAGGSDLDVNGQSLRSRLDPNGVLYYVYSAPHGIVAVRPHPLPPSWLSLDAGPEGAWDGTLAPGASREITLTFRAGAREVGDYTSALQAFDAATGEAVEVPLVMEVLPTTAGEDDVAAPEASSLSVYPNPFAEEASVALILAERSEVRVAVYDVLGRTVAVLHEGPVAAGTRRFTLGGAALPAGLYLVRAEVSGPGGAVQALTARLTHVD